MKEKTLIELKNSVLKLNSTVQALAIEINHLKTLSFGNSKVLQKMPGYDEAINNLKEKAQKDVE